MSSARYICLPNPHDGEWKVFKKQEGKDAYAPTYGCPISTGATYEEAVEEAHRMWDIPKELIE